MQEYRGFIDEVPLPHNTKWKLSTKVVDEYYDKL
jgi:hypothetical protein